MKTNYTKIFVIVFIVMLSIPIVFTLLKVKTQPLNKNEKPISLNFSRNFPLKRDLFKLYAYGKTNIFNVDPIPNRVIELENGWKFVGNEFSNALSESKGIINSTKKELEAFKKRLTEKKDWCEANGIKFYIAVAPNKHSIYGDKIPIKQSPKKTKRQQLDSLCKVIGVNFIYLGEKFPKGNPKQLYFKTDTHWNFYAGHYAYQSTMEAIKLDFKDTNFKDFKLSDMEEGEKELVIGDINKMLMQEKDEKVAIFKFKEPETATRLEKQLEIPKDYHKDPLTYETRYKSEINDLKILIFNDSFLGYYSNYFYENFGSTVALWNFVFDKELILKEKPDILYHEILERDIEFLLY